MAFAYILRDGRIFVDYGPVSMIVTVQNPSMDIFETKNLIERWVYQSLVSLSKELNTLKKYPEEIETEFESDLAKNMLLSVKATGYPKLTPMSAVAGTIADKIAELLVQTGAEKVIVNNGGDIAIRMKEGDQLIVGIKRSLREDANIDKYILRNNHIRGIATSGFGGRSFTQGVADSVTVFSESASLADAFATYLADMTHICSDKVHEAIASDIDPETDIGDQKIVISIDSLSELEIKEAFDNLNRVVEQPLQEKKIDKVICYIAGFKKVWEVFK